MTAGSLIEPRVLLDHPSDVGEGPLWDEVTSRLLWVDILRGEIHATGMDGSDTLVVTIDDHVGAVALAEEGHLLAALRDEVVLLDPHGHVAARATFDRRDDHRSNDGAVAPDGSFWFGTMGYDPRPGTAALHRLAADGTVSTLLEGVGLSNGLDWSPDGETFYYVDSLAGRVRRFRYLGGSLDEQAPFAEIAADDGLPDGLTVDSEGHVWLALWGGAEVQRFDPAGELVLRIPFPVSQVSSVAFGGDDLGTLCITTASHGLSPTALARERGAGSLFTIDPPCPGLPAATGIAVDHLNLGGGFGIPYFAADAPLDLAAVGAGLRALLDGRSPALATTRIVVELGRYIVGEAGVYLTRVVDRKVSRGTTFLVTDGGLHHQLAASGNFGTVIRRNYPVANASRFAALATANYDLVGCLCTPLDRLATDVDLPDTRPGDLIAIFMAGAYGATASPGAFLGHPAAREIFA